MVQKKDVEKSCSNKAAVAKLRRLANALETKSSFEIQIAGERISIPPHAAVEFEYTRDGKDEELEIELKWRRK